MATIQRPPRQTNSAETKTPLAKGFDYLTLDPGPRLRRLKEAQLSSDPAETLQEAWLTVRRAMAKALRIISESR